MVEAGKKWQTVAPVTIDDIPLHADHHRDDKNEKPICPREAIWQICRDKECDLMARGEDCDVGGLDPRSDKAKSRQ